MSPIPQEDDDTIVSGQNSIMNSYTRIEFISFLVRFSLAGLSCLRMLGFLSRLSRHSYPFPRPKEAILVESIAVIRAQPTLPISHIGNEARTRLWGFESSLIPSRPP